MVFNQKAFAKRVKEARNRKNLTQEQLAEKLSISVKHMGGNRAGDKALFRGDYCRNFGAA